jgi:hypothetical protein
MQGGRPSQTFLSQARETRRKDGSVAKTKTVMMVGKKDIPGIHERQEIRKNRTHLRMGMVLKIKTNNSTILDLSIS